MSADLRRRRRGARRRVRCRRRRPVAAHAAGAAMARRSRSTTFARYLIHDPIHHLWDVERSDLELPAMSAGDARSTATRVRRRIDGIRVAAMAERRARQARRTGCGRAIEAHADDGERLRRLPMPTVKALADADLMRLCVPAVYGGPEADPMTMVEVIEAVAQRGRSGRVVHDDRVDHVVDGVVPPRRPRRGRSTATGPSITGGVFAPNGHGVSATAQRRRRVRGDRPLGVGEWHPALSVGARRRVVRRRDVPPVLDAAVAR